MERVNETANEVTELADEYLDCVAGGASGIHLDEAVLTVVAGAPSSEVAFKNCCAGAHY